MSLLNELYQEVIVDHTRSPRNFGELPDASHQAEGYNPLCGDQLRLFLKIDSRHIIQEVRFIGTGCSISTSSASLMTEALKGLSLAEAEKLFTEFHAMLTQDVACDTDHLGKLAVFAGVKEYPSRVKCATLAWHTFQAAVQHQTAHVSTE